MIYDVRYLILISTFLIKIEKNLFRDPSGAVPMSDYMTTTCDKSPALNSLVIPSSPLNSIPFAEHVSDAFNTK